MDDSCASTGWNFLEQLGGWSKIYKTWKSLWLTRKGAGSLALRFSISEYSSDSALHSTQRLVSGGELYVDVEGQQSARLPTMH